MVWAGPGRAENFENVMGRAGPGWAENLKTLMDLEIRWAGPGREYGGVGGYFEHVKQPFAVKVHPNVQFVADVHSYMMDSAEVIGVLAGRYDREQGVLYIQAAVPCLEEERSKGDRGKTEVEANFMSLHNAGQAIKRSGLQEEFNHAGTRTHAWHAQKRTIYPPSHGHAPNEQIGSRVGV
eukprot:jgi/Undpi1/12468/HiC_scaffold_5.g02139.m1